MTFSNAINWLRRDGPRWENLGITLSAGTFSITQANGSALSANDAGYVTLPSKASPGQQIVYRITANQTFIDDAGSSTIIGNLFGLTTGIAFAQDVPFYIYAVSNDAANEVSFMISRYPSATVSPSSSFIGKTGSAVADTQGSFFAFENPTVTDYDANPCICIGAIRMRMSSSDDWTVQTLSDGSGFGTITFIGADGIGQFHEMSKFTMATGQFGAATSSFWKANGGTAPIFSTNTYTYFVKRDGVCLISHFNNNCTTAGVGAVQALLAMPYLSANSAPAAGNFAGTFSAAAYIGCPQLISGANTLQFQVINTTPVNLTNGSFNLAAATNAQSSVVYVIEYI